MVERLKQAIEKARQQREVAATPPAVRAPAQDRPALGSWRGLESLVLDPDHLTQGRIVSHSRDHWAFQPFDLLRTRISTVCQSNGWRRIGVTSPTKGCGKSAVTLNLAFSLGRNQDLRTMVIDCDLRKPSLAKLLGVRSASAVPELLGDAPDLAKLPLRYGDNLAFCLNDRPLRNSAELLGAAQTSRNLNRLLHDFEPDLVLIDLQPVLAGDDVLAFLGNLDAILIVIGAGLTTAHEVEESRRMIGADTNFLGVVLNKVTVADNDAYDYDYSTTPVADRPQPAHSADSAAAAG